MARLNSGAGQIAALNTRMDAAQLHVVTFSLPGVAPEVPRRSVPFTFERASSIQRVRLSAQAAPIGGPVTVEYALDEVAFATVVIEDGSLEEQVVDGVVAAALSSELTVNLTARGAETPAEDIRAQVVYV